MNMNTKFTIDIDNEIDDENEILNVEIIFDDTTLTIEKVEKIIDRLDNYYDLNGLNDIFNDSYDNTYKIEMFFEIENLTMSDEELKKDIEKYLNGLTI